MNPIAEQLAKHRRSEGVSVRDLGSKIGISGAQVLQLERGAALPSVSTLCALANYFAWPDQLIAMYVRELARYAPSSKLRKRRKRLAAA